MSKPVALAEVQSIDGLNTAELVNLFLMSGDNADRDNGIIDKIFELETVSYNQISSSNQMRAKAQRSVIISRLRTIPNESSVSLLSDDESFNEELLKRAEKLNKYFMVFQPAIYKSIEDHFGARGAEEITFTAKPAGQQVGTVARVRSGDMAKAFYVKAHQNFLVASDSFAHITSDNTRNIDYKELFVYRALQYMGYGPKTDFIVSGDMTNPSIRETGLLIASQDLSHTKDEGKTKKFRTFESIRKEIRTSFRAEGLEGDQLDRTLQDRILPALDNTNIKKIDLLSRIFLLSDVMVNQGNFGSVEREKDGETFPSKWKILDFTIAKSGLHTSPEQYLQDSIARDFREVNGRLRYDENAPIRALLQGRQDESELRAIFGEVREGRQGIVSKKLGIEEALARSFDDIKGLMESNCEALKMKEDLHHKKLEDLNCYQGAILQNLSNVERGVEESLSHARK